MKKTILLSAIASCMMVWTASAIAADATTTPATDTTITPVVQQITPMSAVLRNLQASGYVAIKEVRLEDGFYKAEAINAQGKKIDVRIDPETGKIVEPKSTQPAVVIDIITAVNKVEAAGYHGIYKIEAEDGKYDVKALDQNGKNVHLKVDAQTGKVTKKWFG
jgi:hypothetical protein